VSRQTVNAVETGRYEPSLSLAFAIAALFARPIESIFQWKRQLPRFTGEPDTKSGEP
jgi:putative transcriptional regulator